MYFLVQMIAMRYGAVPIARKTGGLNDRWASHCIYVYFIGPSILKLLGLDIFIFNLSLAVFLMLMTIQSLLSLEMDSHFWIPMNR